MLVRWKKEVSEGGGGDDDDEGAMPNFQLPTLGFSYNSPECRHPNATRLQLGKGGSGGNRCDCNCEKENMLQLQVNMLRKPLTASKFVHIEEVARD